MGFDVSQADGAFYLLPKIPIELGLDSRNHGIAATEQKLALISGTAFWP